ncbi:uncharacterized protein LOC131044554 [Cryptomeria japonica]|uniref:uncharacterized protein LOC131044554 n=1 Tax=Cryptomeria japonica TaxID=3369 RepID=UPI0027DA03DB|nr:uncharacterized protein LOC131044554 [Cryptomeria japonica]
MEDRNKILGGSQWCWEDNHPLMLKPWHPTFNPELESFDRAPMWIRLPNLPLQYWFDSCFEAIGNSLGKFLLIDDGSLNLLHTTFARVLVEMDTSMGLPSEISISTSKGVWLQSMDYEGIPFRCRRCLKTGHNVDSCAKRRVKSLASWWKDVTPQSYVMEKVAGNLKSHQDVRGLINDSIAKVPELSNEGQGPAGGLVGKAVCPEGCSSFQDAIGGV